MLKNKKSILFVCIHNSARSQMAEAFLNSISTKFSANSAGIEPGILNPLVIESMKNIGNLTYIVIHHAIPSSALSLYNDNENTVWRLLQNTERIKLHNNREVYL